MNRVFGLVGYACNGKSSVIEKVMGSISYKFIDIPCAYRDEAAKLGYSGVTEWYSSVPKEIYKEQSYKAAIKYFDTKMKECTDFDIIIDDVFDSDVYTYIKSKLPSIKLVAFHSLYGDRLKRLAVRTEITDEKELISGLNKRDEMKKYCGIEKVFPHCKASVLNDGSLEDAKKIFLSELNRNNIICIVGYSGSGKTTISKYISEKYDIPLFKFGKSVTSAINNLGFSKSREYVKAHGYESYVKTVYETVKKDLEEFKLKHQTFILDGIFSSQLFNDICNSDEVYTLYIQLDYEKRIQRLSGREECNFILSKIELDTKDSMKLRCGLDIITAKSDFRFVNDINIETDLEKILKSNTPIFNYIPCSKQKI